MLPVDVCAYYNSKCVGDLLDGKLCECPVGKRGAFCERDGYGGFILIPVTKHGAVF